MTYDIGVPMLYDSASNPHLPCLYICPVANVLGRAPLIPCFIGAGRQPLPHDPTTLQGQSAFLRRLRRHAAGPGQRQQALRGEHLDVLRPGPLPHGVCSGGWEDKEPASQQEQAPGGRDEEASQRGHCRSGGCRRRRRGGELWYHILDYDIIVFITTMIS